jgi:hypothetical protein
LLFPARMRASSPALDLVSRPLAVPRPRPRAVPPDEETTTEYAFARGEAPEARHSDIAPRPTLRSEDIEDIPGAEAPRSSSVPPPLPDRARTPRKALSGPADAVFAALRDLAFFETPVEAASFGAATAMSALPSLAALALLRDEENGGYVVVYARGPRAQVVVRSRIREDDPLVGLALVRGAPVQIEYGSDTPPPDRHAAFGDPWSALVAPIEVDDRCIGVLELVDPLDGRALGESARYALATIAQHLAAFLRGKPIVVANAFAPEQLGLED